MQGDLALRDIPDVRAYVGAVVHTIAADRDLREDMLQEGIRLVYEREKDLAPGKSLRRVVGGRVSAQGGSWLRCRLLNYVERSARQPIPMEDLPADDRAVAKDAAEVALSNLALRILERREHVRNPNLVACYLNAAGLYSGASHRPPGSAASEEIWATAKAEREEFGQILGFDVDPNPEL